MRAAYAARIDAERPLDGLVVGELDPGEPPAGFTVVDVRAAALNHHDVWSLRGVGLPADRLPMVLGCDAAGVDPDGREVVVHAVIPEDGRVSLLSERHHGTLAERVAVPAANLVPKPAELSWEEAACLPTAYLTAFNMLFGRARLVPGEHVLVQGAGGGVATAAIVLAVAAGLEVTATSRDEARRERALALGAHHAVPTGTRLPSRVDAVVETVGAATWAHSLRAVRNGGRLVVAGATSGFDPPSELQQLFMRDVSVLGTLMGDRRQLELLTRFLVTTGVRPVIDSVRPLGETRDALALMVGGDVFGKLVIRPGE